MRRLGLAALVALAVATPAMAAPVLEKVVLLQRHGVRAPTQAPDELAPYARQAWPHWPVAPGELTDHGAASLARMGDALRAHYTRAGLLPRTGCPARDAVYVWADNADQRTRRSGAVMAETLAPNCGVKPAMAQGHDDVLFHAGDRCPVDPAAAQAALSARLADVLAKQRDVYDAARTRLQSVLNPDVGDCTADTSRKCVIAAGRSEAKDGKISGTLDRGSTLSEDLFLEYAQGMPSPGWGQVNNAADLAAVMPLHRLYSDLARRTPAIAVRSGTLVARQIESMLVTTAPFTGQAPVPASARLVVLAGHDTNIANLAGLLGLDWVLPGEPDVTAPDTAMAFELWRDGKTRFVRVKLFYQTPDQLRDLTAFDAAHPVPQLALTLPGCAEQCSLKKTQALLDAKLARECLER